MKRTHTWLAITFFAIVFSSMAFFSCRHNNSQDKSVEAIVEQVWQFSKTHPDGFTVDVRTMEEVSEGIAVAYAATQGRHSRESLFFVVSLALENDGLVGGWLDSESGLYFFDSTKIFPEDQLDEALAFARKNGQSAVYILSTDEEIRLDEVKIAA